MMLLALHGRAGAGKDTFADRLVERHGFVRYAFAKPIKDMLRAIGVDCDNRATKELPHPVFGVSPRRMAQTLGTEWMRNLVCEDGWLRLAKLQFMVAAQERARGFVITDCRFENEADWAQENGGYVVEILRPGISNVEAHASENGLPRKS